MNLECLPFIQQTHNARCGATDMPFKGEELNPPVCGLPDNVERLMITSGLIEVGEALRGNGRRLYSEDIKSARLDGSRMRRELRKFYL
jgi:hypothetical protein